MDNVFPSTHESWLHEMLSGCESRREQATKTLMARYRDPLCVYFQGSNFAKLRGSGLLDFWDGEDLVHRFLINRLAQPKFIERWRTSGFRLRRWIANAFVFYLREQARSARRKAAGEKRRASVVDWRALTAAPVSGFDRAWAAAVIREASELTSSVMASRGRADHWELFTRHFVDGIPYGELVEPFGVSPSRAASISREVSFELRRNLRAVLSRDGIGEDELGSQLAEIESLLRPEGSRG